MDTLSYKTISANKSTVQKDWYVVDADQKVLGRMVTRIADVLRGKHKPYYTPHVDCGDNIVVINADKIRLTGNKWKGKKYVTYSGYPGGQKIRTAKQLMERKPIAMVEHAVKGMLPKNRLGRAIFRKIHVYAGPDHPHQAQKPKTLNV